MRRKGKHFKEKGKHFKKISKIIEIAFIIFIIMFIYSAVKLIYYSYDKNKNKDNNDFLSNVEIDENKINDNKTKRILQLEELQKVNNEIIGILEIEGTNIQYPVLQTTNNDFYLNHNYKKEKSSAGSLFLDKDADILNGCSNYLIYGHRNNNGLMFEDLLKFNNEDFYKEHKQIKFTTNKEDATYEILSVFYSRVYYKSEKNVFRYYYFINANNEQEYNDFVENAKKVSLYDTGVTAEYGEQLLTLSTCEYSQEDGRFAIVCKKIK